MSVFVQLLPSLSDKEIDLMIYFQDPLFPNEGDKFNLKINVKKGKLPEDITMPFPYNRISHITANLLNAKYIRRIGRGWQFDNDLYPEKSAGGRRELVDQVAKETRKAVLSRLHIGTSIKQDLDQSWFGAATPPV